MCDPMAVPLSPMDNVMPRIYANFVLAFPLRSSHDFGPVHELLQKSLEQTCDVLPVLRCKVFTIPGDKDKPSTGRLAATRCDGWYPDIAYNDISKTWPDYEDLLDDGLQQDLLDGQQLLPRSESEWDLVRTGAPALVAQANYVTSGLLLAVGIFHPVVDGASASLLLKLWAGNARALQGREGLGPAITMHPDSSNYALLDKIWAAEDKCDPQPGAKMSSEQLWRLVGLLPPTAPAASKQDDASSSTPTRPLVETRIFYMSGEAFARLTSRCLTSGGPRVTANDALMALLWRCIIRARAAAAAPSSRAYAPGATTMLDTTLDGRALVGAPLPWSYMGTLVFIVTTAASVGDLIDRATDIAAIARKFRESVDAVGRGHALKAFGLAAGLADYGDSLRHPFATFEGAEVCITSWVGISVFDISFGDVLFSGGGRPDRLRPPRREFDAFCRRCVVLPMQASGGFEVLVSLEKGEIAALETDPEFLDFVSVVGT